MTAPRLIVASLVKNEASKFRCRRIVSGYVRLYTTSKKYIYEHIDVAEAALGHPLPKGAHVHHVNGDGTDNRHSNLVICESAAYHRLLHRRQRAVEAGGKASYKKCKWCGRYDEPARMYVYRNGLSAEHRACRRLDPRDKNAARNRRYGWTCRG